MNIFKFMFGLLCENGSDPLACQDNLCLHCLIQNLFAEDEDGRLVIENKYGLDIPDDAIVTFAYYRKLTLRTKKGKKVPKRTFATDEVSAEVFFER